MPRHLSGKAFPFLMMMLLFLQGTSQLPAQDGKSCSRWKHYCIDAYFIAPKIGSAHVLGVRSVRNERNRKIKDLEVPPLKRTGNGIHELSGKDRFAYAGYIRSRLKGMTEDMNNVMRPCRIWFSIRKVYFIDPDRVVTEGGRPIRSLFGKLDRRRKVLLVDPKKTIDLLNAARRIADRHAGGGVHSGSPRCLSMFFVHFPANDTRSEAGKAATPGNVSLVDMTGAFDRKQQGILPLHEALHNLGIRKHSGKREPSAVYDRAEDRRRGFRTDSRDVMAKEHEVNAFRQLRPYINARHCRILCSRGPIRGLVSPVHEAPPVKKDSPPAEEKKRAKRADTKKCGPQKNVKDGLSRLPDLEFSDDEVRTHDRKRLAMILERRTAAWRRAFPEIPKGCCDRETLEKIQERMERMMSRFWTHYRKAMNSHRAAWKAWNENESDKNLKALEQKRDMITSALRKLHIFMLKRFLLIARRIQAIANDRKCGRKPVKRTMRRKDTGHGTAKKRRKHRYTSRPSSQKLEKFIRPGLGIAIRAGSGKLGHHKRKRPVHRQERRPERRPVPER